MRGRFIVFEGPEGAGKSTQAVRLAAWLEARGHDVVMTREPGGTEIGESIRSILLVSEGRAMLPATEALLYAAGRAQHVGEVIRPALARGAVVVCDRFVDSSLAYQAGGLGLPLADVAAIQGLATGGLAPDLKILLDLPVDVGLARRFAAGAVNRVDLAGVAFHERVRSTYHRQVATSPDDWLVVDATESPEWVAAAVAAAVGRLVGDVDDGAR